jgi:TRAP-type C4-dicarboxylate transport system substrate-binding protein
MWLAATVAVVAAGCFGGGGKTGGEGQKRAIVLTLATHESRDLEEFAIAVEQLSKGSVRVVIKDNWRDREIDYDRGTIADVRSGKVDLAKIGVRSFDALGVPTLQPLVAPLLVDSLGLEGKVLASRLAKRMLASVGRLGVEGIALLPGELRRPFGVSRRLVAPSDYRAATIGTRPSLVATWTFQALGAVARGYVPGDLLPSFDGAELDLLTIQGNEYDAPGTSFTANVALWPRAFAVVGNRRTFSRLTPEQQDALRKAGTEALAPALERLRAEGADDIGILCRRRKMEFVNGTPAQLDSLRAAVRPVYARLVRDPQTRAAIREIQRMKRGLAAEKPPRCSGGTSGRGGASSLDGVYEVDTTEADLQRAGTPARDLVPENWGHWVYVVDGGRMAFTQEDAQACTWAYGKLKVSGHSMTWSILDGGYTRSPNLAYNRPGEFFTFGWSRYRDTLTLTSVKGASSPPNFRAKPWHLVSRTPSRNYLSKGCPPPKGALR